MIKSLHVALLETKIFLKDKAGLAFSLLLPIAIFSLMYGAFGGQTLFYGTAHVVNLDDSGAHAQSLIYQLNEVENLDIVMLTEAEAQRKLDRSDILIAFYIPEDFSADIESGQSTQLSIRQRGNGGSEGQITASIFRSIVEGMNQQLQVHAKVATSVAASGASQQQINTVVENYTATEQQTVSVNTLEQGESPDPVNEFLPGIVTMFILFGISMNARALYEERKRGTLERLITTRLSITQMFAGKFIAYVLRGFIQTLILFSLAYAVFGMFTPASFFQALVLSLMFSGAAGSFGLIIGSISKSEGQAIWMAVFFTMTMVMLGGTFFPIQEGTVLHYISKLSLNTYINDALKSIVVHNNSLASVWPEILIMAGVIVAGLLLSRYLFRVIAT